MEMEINARQLRWPEGWQRTRLQDRKTQAAWKKTYQAIIPALEKELTRMKATSALVTHNPIGSEDSGVAVYFTLKPVDQYGWQEALGFVGEVPTVAQIDRAYAERVRKVHPDGPTPDVELFRALTRHRDMARAWARGEQLVEHDKVIACDTFREVRLNVNAIRLTISAMRQIERCGSSLMIDRAWRAFHRQLTAQASAGTLEEKTA